MEIRRAQEADMGAIAQMWHLQWHQGHAAVVDPDLVGLRVPDEFVARTNAHLAQTHVAVLDGVLAGFFMVEGDELYQFYVGGLHQGSGLAQVMMRAAEAVLPGPRGWLACSVGNDRAARFYEKCGWGNMGEEKLEVETSAGPRLVRIWRFEKDV